MKQMGIPACPYCGKRVNMIRMWTLKRDGEFVCPSCGGYSNVHHMPVMNFFAAVCGIIAFVIFAFTRFFLNKSDFMTCVYVFLPFAVFFVGSMFLVQLKEPVLRQGRHESAAARRDEAVLRRRRQEAVSSERRKVSYTPRSQAEGGAAAVTHARPAAQPVRRVPEPAEKPTRPQGEYTDISSQSGTAPLVRRTPAEKTGSQRDIYSTSRGQGQSYAYSTSARLREQEDEAAALRRRKIEMLRRLQQQEAMQNGTQPKRSDPAEKK